ncbi:unnamed protein product [Caenorhabditis nigoni]
MSDDEDTTMSSELPDPPPFQQIDEWLATIQVHECTKAFGILEAYLNKGNRSAEILWRLARYFLTIANFSKTKEEHLKEIQKAIAYAREAFETEKTFLTASWAAIASYKLIKKIGFREKMEELNQCKIFVDHALSLDPHDLDMLYLRGRWYLMVSQLTWIQRTKSSLMSIPPPEGTLDQAIDDFKTAYLIAPFCQKTTVYLAISLFEKRDFETAKMHFEHIVKMNKEPKHRTSFVNEAENYLAKCNLIEVDELVKKARTKIIGGRVAVWKFGLAIRSCPDYETTEIKIFYNFFVVFVV